MVLSVDITMEGWINMLYIIHETLADTIPEARNTLVTRDAGTRRERLQKWLTYDIHNLDLILDKIEIDIAIVNTCLTYEGEKIKMIMAANDYEEYY
jgi:hypothetical protein